MFAAHEEDNSYYIDNSYYSRSDVVTTNTYSYLPTLVNNNNGTLFRSSSCSSAQIPQEPMTRVISSLSDDDNASDDDLSISDSQNQKQVSYKTHHATINYASLIPIQKPVFHTVPPLPSTTSLKSKVEPKPKSKSGRKPKVKPQTEVPSIDKNVNNLNLDLNEELVLNPIIPDKLNKPVVVTRIKKPKKESVRKKKEPALEDLKLEANQISEKWEHNPEIKVAKAKQELYNKSIEEDKNQTAIKRNKEHAHLFIIALLHVYNKRKQDFEPTITNVDQKASEIMNTVSQFFLSDNTSNWKQKINKKELITAMQSQQYIFVAVYAALCANNIAMTPKLYYGYVKTIITEQDSPLVDLFAPLHEAINFTSDIVIKEMFETNWEIMLRVKMDFDFTIETKFILSMYYMRYFYYTLDPFSLKTCDESFQKTVLGLCEHILLLGLKEKWFQFEDTYITTDVNMSSDDSNSLFYHSNNEQSSHKVSFNKFARQFWYAGFIVFIWLTDRLVQWAKQESSLKSHFKLYSLNKITMNWISNEDCNHEFLHLLKHSSFSRTKKSTFIERMKKYTIENVNDIKEYFMSISEYDSKIITSIVDITYPISFDYAEKCFLVKKIIQIFDIEAPISPTFQVMKKLKSCNNSNSTISNTAYSELQNVTTATTTAEVKIDANSDEEDLEIEDNNILFMDKNTTIDRKRICISDDDYYQQQTLELHIQLNNLLHNASSLSPSSFKKE